jgi:hypothetical protein
VQQSNVKGGDDLTFERWLDAYPRFAPVLERAQSIGIPGRDAATADPAMAGGKPEVNRGGRPKGSGNKAKGETGAAGQATNLTGTSIA